MNMWQIAGLAVVAAFVLGTLTGMTLEYRIGYFSQRRERRR